MGDERNGLEVSRGEDPDVLHRCGEIDGLSSRWQEWTPNSFGWDCFSKIMEPKLP